MENAITLPPEIHCNIFSDVADVRTLSNIKHVGGNLFEIAAYCVKYIQTDKYNYVDPKLVTSYYNTKVVRGIIKISRLEDVVNIASHPSLRSAIIKFNFAENAEIIMVSEFLNIYLQDKRKLGTTNIMLLLNDNRYIYISRNVLYVVYQDNVDTNVSTMLNIIVDLLSTGLFDNIYILLNWLLVEGDSMKKKLYTKLNNISTPVNLLIPDEYEYEDEFFISQEEFLSYPLKYLHRVNITWNKSFTELESGVLFNEPSDTLEYLTGPLEFISTTWHFEPDNNMVYAPNLHTLGYILSSDYDRSIYDIDLHPNIHTVIFYTNDPELIGIDQVVEDVRYICTGYPVMDFNPLILFRDE